MQLGAIVRSGATHAHGANLCCAHCAHGRIAYAALPFLQLERVLEIEPPQQATSGCAQAIGLARAQVVQRLKVAGSVPRPRPQSRLRSIRRAQPEHRLDISGTRRHRCHAAIGEARSTDLAAFDSDREGGADGGNVLIDSFGGIL